MTPPAARDLTPAPAGEDVLTVLRDPLGADSPRWARLVDELAAVLGVAVSDLPLDLQGPDATSRLLHVAAAAPGPMLVLPRVRPGELGAAPPPRLLRVLIASGDSSDVVDSARFLSDRLRAAGVRTAVLVVLSDGALPSMWEGAGHHAAAWREELARRHGDPDELEVLSGDAGVGPAIRARAAGAGVLLLVWRRVAAEGRAEVVRAVLDTGGEDEAVLPCLLVPITWVEGLRDRTATRLPEEATRPG